MKVSASTTTRRGKGVPKATSAQKDGKPVLPQEYQTIFTNNGRPMVILEADTIISLANAEFERLSGYTREEIEGNKRWTEFVGRGDRGRMREYHLLRKSDPMLAPRCFEFRFVDRHGEVKNVVLTMGQIPGTNKSMASLLDVTERRRAEATQRASEKRYKAFFENSKDAVYITTRDGACIDANQAAVDLVGYTREEMKKVKVQDLYADPADRRRLQKEIEGQGFVRDFEVRLRKKDGTEMDCLLAATAERGNNGSILEYQCIVRDITERKKAEKALRESEEKYRTILESIEDGYGELDLHGKLTFFNDALPKILGYPKDELKRLDTHDRQYLDRETAHKVYQIHNKVYTTGKPERGFQYEITAKDGSKRYLENSIHLIKDEARKPVGFRGITRDITERKRMEGELKRNREQLEELVKKRTTELQAVNERLQRDITERGQMEEALRESEEKYRSMLANIGDAYTETDLSGRVTFFNKAVSESLGYTEEEFVGMHYKEYTSPENEKKIYEIYNKVYKTGEPAKSVELEYTAKDGTIKILESTVDLMRGKSGKPIGFKTFTTDITQRRQAEEALCQSEEKYRTILEKIQEGYFEMDLAGHFTFVNDTECRNLGYTREELIGMSNRQYQDETTAKKVYQIYNGIYKTGEPVKALNVEVIRKDGTKVFNETSVSLIRDAQGKPIGFRGLTRDVTERKRAEEALRQSEERYRSILGITGDAYTENDLAGNMIFINQESFKFLGWPEEEFVGMSYKDYTTPENAKKLFEIYNRVYRTGEPARLAEYELIAKDGTTKIAEATVELIRDKSGKPIGFRTLTRDITKRRQTEEALHQSEEKYRTILENIEDGYGELDLHGKLTFFNDALPKILGYPKDELKSLDFNNRQYIDKENAETVYQAYSNVYTTGKPNRGFQYDIIAQDGTRRHLESSISLRRDAGGQPVGFQGVVRDITERKQAEERLRQSEERYRTIIETIEDGYYEIDLAGHFTFVNDVVCSNLGYTREELIGTKSRQYQDEATGKKLHEIYNEVYRTGKPVRALEGEYVRKDGIKKTYEMSASLIRDAGGKPIGFRGISRDVTERKRAEERLQRYAAELERSNEEVKNFAYIVSHDLRVPLVNLKGYTSELRSALGVIGPHCDAALLQLDDEKRSEVTMALHEDVPEALEFITTSVSRMDSFINAVLVLSRLGRRELRPEPLDMEALVQQSLENLSHQIQERGIEVTIGPLPEVVADRTSMEQITGNILGNAVKYLNPERPAQITVTARPNNTETIFRIQDTGRGIAEDDMHKVFAPFRRAGKQDTPGEGMGLAYVQTLVRRHGGRIWCESEVGKGTTFTFTIATPSGKGAHDA